MYVGVLLVLVGWAVAFQSLILAAYTVVAAVAFHLRVVLTEEPTLSKTFGHEWDMYRQKVPRWPLPLSCNSRAQHK